MTITGDFLAALEGNQDVVKLYEGPFDVFQSGVLPCPATRLTVFGAENKTLAIVSNLPRATTPIAHSAAAEQIVRAFGATPENFYYLHRVPAGTGGLLQDLFTQYAYGWEWNSKVGAHQVKERTYCYRLTDSRETAVKQLLARLDEPKEIDQKRLPDPEQKQLPEPEPKEVVVNSLP